MPVKKQNLLDSFAVLALLNEEAGADRVEGLLRAADRSGTPVLLNEINVGEVYYIRAKSHSPTSAERFLEALATLPISVVHNSYADVLDAARLKAQFPISYADAFAAATAIRTSSVLVTGDEEFRPLSGILEILWL
jgi:predicted nucleic acid-binding protein